MLELLATACAGLFAGAAVFVSVAQHPATLDAGTDAAVAFFPPMYRRAGPMQASLAVTGAFLGAVVWIAGSGVAWLVGAALLGSVVPVTLVRIKPVNDALLAPGLDPEDPQVPELLRRWGQLHRVRSALGAAAFLVYLVGRV